MSSSSLWQRFQQYYLYYADLGFSLDISRMKFPDDFLEKMQPKVDKAFAAMRALEAGAIANPTEKRMVGHYWPRNPALSPTPEIRTEVTEANAFNIGALIALYERAVGFYASLVNINAYDQPGVEAGKKAATRLLELQKQVRVNLTDGAGKTAEEVARSIDADVFHVLRHLACNDPHIRVSRGDEQADDRFSYSG